MRLRKIGRLQGVFSRIFYFDLAARSILHKRLPAVAFDTFRRV